MSESLMFSSVALLEALDTQPLPEDLSMLLAIEPLSFEQGLIDAVRTTWKEAPEQATLLDLLPEYDDFENDRFGMPHYMWGKAMMCVWWMLCEWLPEFTPQDVSIDGTDNFSEHLVVPGNLVIKGDFKLDSYTYYQAMGGKTDWRPHLIVLGDLVVEGNFEHDGGFFFVGGNMHVAGYLREASDWSLVVVREDVSSREHIDSRGELYVGGRLMAPLLELTYNHGESVVMGDVAAVVLIVSDHGESWLGGEIQAPVASVEAMAGPEGEWSDVPSFSLETLRDSLETALGGELLEGGYEEDGVLFDADECEIYLPDFFYEIRFTHARERSVRELFSESALARFDNVFNR